MCLKCFLSLLPDIQFSQIYLKLRQIKLIVLPNSLRVDHVSKEDVRKRTGWKMINKYRDRKKSSKLEILQEDK